MLLHQKFIERFEALSARQQGDILAALQEVAVMMDAGDIDAAPLLDVSKLA